MQKTSSDVTHSVILPGLAVFGTVLTWAASFPAIGYALREIEPLPLASVRFAMAAILAGLLLAWRRPRMLSLRDNGVVLICGVLGIALYNVLLNSGQTTVSAGAASFIVNTQPLFMAVFAVFFLKETFSRWSWLGAALSFAGVAIIGSGQPGGFSFGAGSSLIIAAAACAAAYSVLQRPLFTRAAPMDITAFVLITGALALLPWLASGLNQAMNARPDTLFAVTFLAIAPALIGQTCWTYALKSFGAARAGQFLYLIPPASVLLAWFLLGEAPQWCTLAGGVLALSGVLIVNTWGRAKA
ncbi:DMT family transporter [Terrarubrum flagellatum]|uniref:DMT family transporter n=1 Tax=Terrirubrum flagellatum TaxID=2895980 RepID=UPI00314566A3